MALEDYYVARMASIYRTKPKASAHVALFAKQMLADGLAMDIPPSLDIDQAVGTQLDVIGKYVGAPRDVGVADTRPYFGFVGYDYPSGTQNGNGFVSYASLAINAQGAWFEYEFTGKSTSQLPDYSYRQLLKLKIFTNSSNNTMAAIQGQITGFFPNQLQLRDNLDMSLTYFYGGTFQLPLSVLESALPRPMGVKVTAIEAIAFDVAINGTPAFNSETPDPSVSYGTIQFSDSLSFALTNAKASSFTVVAIAITEGADVFEVGVPSPLLPTVLDQGETVTFPVSATSNNLLINYPGKLSIFLSSLAGLSRFDVDLSVSVSGITITWMVFDNFQDYADGSITTLNDSWGWAASGVFNTGITIVSSDNLQTYADGNITELTAGSGWADNGIFTTY